MNKFKEFLKRNRLPSNYGCNDEFSSTSSSESSTSEISSVTSLLDYQNHEQNDNQSEIVLYTSSGRISRSTSKPHGGKINQKESNNVQSDDKATDLGEIHWYFF